MSLNSTFKPEQLVMLFESSALLLSGVTFKAPIKQEDRLIGSRYSKEGGADLTTPDKLRVLARC